MVSFLRGNGPKKEKDTLKTFKDYANKQGGVVFKMSDRYISGFPDIIYLFQGNVWFIELKRPKGRIKGNQVAIGKEIQKEKCNWTCLTSESEVSLFFDRLSREKSNTAPIPPSL